VAIHRLLQQAAYSPEEVRILASAYEDCLSKLNIADSTDPMAETVAKKIIEAARSGIRNPARLVERALAELQVPKSG